MLAKMIDKIVSLKETKIFEMCIRDRTRSARPSTTRPHSITSKEETPNV